MCLFGSLDEVFIVGLRCFVFSIVFLILVLRFKRVIKVIGFMFLDIFSGEESRFRVVVLIRNKKMFSF